MMATAILNSDGLEISSGINFLETHRYEIYGEVLDIEGKGAIVDLDFLNDDFGARDDKGTLWTTPCPSAVGEWSAGVEVAMKDLVGLNRGKPQKIWVPGCARPIFCKSSELHSGYYSACCCEKCCSDAEIETVRSMLEQLTLAKNSDMSEMLKFSDAFQRLVNQRKKLVKKFDSKMKQVALKYFPGSEVRLYTRINVPFLPGSFDFVGADYAVSPSMVPRDYPGELLLQDIKDFRMAPVLFQNPKNVLIMLPRGDIDDAIDLSKLSPELTDYMALKVLEDAEVRNIAERYINSALVPVVA